MQTRKGLKTALSSQTALPMPSVDERIGPKELAYMLELADKGISLNQIAEKLERSTETVHRWLTPLQDSREIAKRRLHGQADVLAQRFVAKAKPRDIVQVFDRIGVTDAPQHGPQIQQNVLILGGTQPVLPQGMASTLDLVAAYQQQQVIEAQPNISRANDVVCTARDITADQADEQ